MKEPKMITRLASVYEVHAMTYTLKRSKYLRVSIDWGAGTVVAVAKRKQTDVTLFRAIEKSDGAWLISWADGLFCNDPVNPSTLR